MTLTEFLLARIDETEKHAKMAATSPVTWLHFANEAGGLDWHVGQYMLDVDPARVLAECKVKRKMVELFGYAESFDTASRVGWYPATVAIRSLALPYEKHPDYRHEWRP